MSGAGLAALAGLLKGAGDELPKNVDSYNAHVATQNRDNILGWAEESSRKWAEEQSKIQKIEKRANAAGVPLPDDPVERNAALASVGADPDAQLPFEQWVAKKQASRAGIAKIQERLNEGGAGLKVDGVAGSKTRQAIAKAIQAEKKADETDPYLQDAMERGGMTLEEARALRAQYNTKRDSLGPAGGVASQASAAQGFMGGGKVEVGQKTTNREWNSETADAIRPEAVASMKQTLGRKEQGTSDIDMEQERLRHKYGLLQPYASKLGEKDLPAILDEIRLIGESRKTRDAANSQLRGDKTQVGIAVLQSDKTMEQVAASADANAAALKQKGELERLKESGRNARHGAGLRFRQGQAEIDYLKANAETARKALSDAVRNVDGLAKALKNAGRDPKKQSAVLDLYGIPNEYHAGFFKDNVEYNTDSLNAWLQEKRASAASAGALLDARARDQFGGDKPSGKGKRGGTSVSDPLGVR